MPQEFVDRICRPAEQEVLNQLSPMQTRRMEERGDYPGRFKLCPNSGPFGATGWMLSWVLAWNQWRAAGGPGTWAKWWADHRGGAGEFGRRFRRAWIGDSG